MVKMSDVAKLAEVSNATVSRVLSSPENVREETRKRVLESIKELNYQPNTIARSFRKMETKSILVIVPDVTNQFFSEVLRGIEQKAGENGYQVLLGNSNNDVEKEYDFLNQLRQRQADGMILLTARMKQEVIEEFSEDFPVVLACEYKEGSSIPTVSIDNISGARKATEHLINLGHKRIAHLSGPMEVILSRDRLKGYHQAMLRNELETDSVLVQEGDYSYEAGYNLMNKLCALEEPPTAVFAANDEMAIGAIKAAKENFFRVPEDIAVVGFDDIKISSIFEPSLTTVSQPKLEIGEKAMELLLKQMNFEELNRKQIVLEDKLILRQSCGFNKKKK
ncbi:LacI family DNA-binding transcriptional regulator [Jeotgalibacillus soli]|nr:LacI family DNA-binding transcriptional regulator [Jeotgalibacillus soli]